MEISDYTKPLPKNASYIQELEYSYYHIIDKAIKEVDTKIKNITMFVHISHRTKTPTNNIVLMNHVINHTSYKTIYPCVSNFELHFYGCDKDDIGNILYILHTNTTYCTEWQVMRVDLSKQQDTEPLTIAYIEATKSV